MAELRRPDEKATTSSIGTASLGVGTASAKGASGAERWNAVADANLYRAKERGRDRVVAEITDPPEP